jgi:hypothetical protein
MVNAISVVDVAGRGDTADQGVLLHKALVTSLRNSSGPVSISFQGLTTVTSSFANLAFVQLLTEWPLSELKKRLKIVNSTRQINEMVKSRVEREGDDHAAA